MGLVTSLFASVNFSNPVRKWLSWIYLSYLRKSKRLEQLWSMEIDILLFLIGMTTRYISITYVAVWSFLPIRISPYRCMRKASEAYTLLFLYQHIHWLLSFGPSINCINVALILTYGNTTSVIALTMQGTREIRLKLIRIRVSQLHSQTKRSRNMLRILFLVSLFGIVSTQGEHVQ